MNRQKLKQLLEDKGVTQTELAKLLGRDKSVITHLLQGKRQLKLEEAIQIADFLGVPLAQLTEGEDAAALVSGMGEPHCIPFQGEPSAQNRQSAQIIRREGGFFLEIHGSLPANAYALEVRDTALELAGFLPGDIVISSLDVACKPGDIVVVQHYRQGSAETLLRRFQPPFLTAHSTDTGFAPLPAEGEQIRVVSPVLQLIRLFAGSADKKKGA